jgi:hypothetical protein
MVVVLHLEFVKLPRHPTFKRKRGVTCAYPNTSRCELLRANCNRKLYLRWWRTEIVLDESTIESVEVERIDSQ